MKLKKINYSNCAIARSVGVTEGAIRYRIKRERSGLPDGRKNKSSGLTQYESVIEKWIEDYQDEAKRPTLKLLYQILRDRHGYKKGYDAVRRYVRKHYPEFYKKGVYIRIETPPGSLIQVDWKEDLKVQFGKPGRWVTVHALIFSLGFSRKRTIIYSEVKDLDAFISCHQKAFEAFGGLAAFIRTDCLKTAIVRWRGRGSVVNEQYGRYLAHLGISVFPSRPGIARDKGKVEKHIRDFFSSFDLKHTVFKDMGELQRCSDQKLNEMERGWRCGATGYSVEESFAYEKQALRPLPQHFPKLPFREERNKVRTDGTVYFDKNYYQVGREYEGRYVLCSHMGTEITFHYDGREIGRFPYLAKSKGMVRLSKRVLCDPEVTMSDQTRMWALEVASRQITIYHEIAAGG